MFKFLALLAVAGIVFIYTPAGAHLKQRVITVVNPAAAERQSLGDLHDRLDAISSKVNSSTFAVAGTAEKIRALNNLLDSAQGTLAAAEGNAQHGDLAESINSLLQDVLPASLKPQPTIIPNCK